MTTIDSRVPSPFAASLLFSYVANYIYDGDAPLAERRAQALSVDQAQLRELLGDAELRELLDPAALETVEAPAAASRREVQDQDGRRPARSADPDRRPDARRRSNARSALPDTAAAVRDLERARRIVALPVAGEPRYVAVEDVARYRDALGVPLPPGLPEALLEPVRDPAGDLALRYARSHGPFTARELAARYGLGTAVAESLLLAADATTGGSSKASSGPAARSASGSTPTCCAACAAARWRGCARRSNRSNADALGRFVVSWHGIGIGPPRARSAARRHRTAAGRRRFPRRCSNARCCRRASRTTSRGMLDTLMAAGEVVWVGVEPLGERDGRIALYLTDHLRRLRPPTSTAAPTLGGRAAPTILDVSAAEHGASFFGAIHEGTGGGFPRETVDALWDLVWQGLITNDTLHAAARVHAERRDPRAGRAPRRAVPIAPAGAADRRGTLVARDPVDVGGPRSGPAEHPSPNGARRSAQQLLTRHGIVTRETVASEAVAGGFSRRLPGAEGDGGRRAHPPRLLRRRPRRRAVRDAGGARSAPLDARGAGNAANGRARGDRSGQSVRRDREMAGDAASTDRRDPSGARVILVEWRAAAYLRRGERELLLFLPEAEPQRSQFAREVARMLLHLAVSREEARRGHAARGDQRRARDRAPGVARVHRGRVHRDRHGSSGATEAWRLRASLVPGPRDGIRIAARGRGGVPMAEPRRSDDELIDNPRPDETRDTEHDRVRSSNDRDQAMERDGRGVASTTAVTTTRCAESWSSAKRTSIPTAPNQTSIATTPTWTSHEAQITTFTVRL